VKKILYKVFLAVNVIFALALLISYLSVLINPVSFALPAFFGLAYPYLLLINIIITILWAMMLRFEALISVIVILIGFPEFSNYIKLVKPTGDRANTYKVMSYNVRLFNFFENEKGVYSEKKVIDLIKSQKPDIVCLQEFFSAGNPAAKEAAIIQALGGRYYSHLKVLGSGKNRFYGILTLSRFPVIRRGEVIHPGSSSLSIYTDVRLNGDTIRIYNNHLQSFRLRRMERSFIEEISAMNEKQPINEMKNISLSLKKGFVKRAIQAQALKVKIDKSPYPVLVLGDFNDTPVSYAYRKIRKGLNDSFVTSGYGAGFTYKGNYPPNRIDYILYDNSLTNTGFQIIKVNYSDHYPIIAYFKKKS
jgi:endonuclease/exonuclease/phosphatase family metal-dependent hydrolase